MLKRLELFGDAICGMDEDYFAWKSWEALLKNGVGIGGCVSASTADFRIRPIRTRLI